MFEKVNPSHPDKVADRIAGAIVDLCYTKSHDPKVACEVLIGHGEAGIQVETSEQISAEDCEAIVRRIAGEDIVTRALIVPQDANLAANQRQGVRAGDNGLFKGVPPTHEQKLLTAIAASIYGQHPYDGKYIIGQAYDKWPNFDGDPDIMEPILGGHELTICQSHAKKQEIKDLLCEFFRKNGAIVLPSFDDRAQIDDDLYFFSDKRINPLGPWTGGPNTDSGATNRKLGSDMGDGVTGGGLNGKDLSKCDVSVNIVCYLKAVHSGQVVTAICSIGDENVTFQYAGGKTETETFRDVVEMARLYILTVGGFEKFSEWGMIRPNTDLTD
jgi:S-adenosylmethionine synthetase